MNKTGVLITNLGTPDAPTPKAIRRYLKEFLSDIRVVDAPRWLWFFILKIILLLRPARVASGYKQVWSNDGSPLLAIGRRQQHKLQNSLGKDYVVELGMRYGNPSIASALDSLMQQGIQSIVVLPLYPQYSATTTASTFDAVSAWAKQQRVLPSLHFIRDYHRHPQWLSALAESVNKHWAEQGRGEKLLMSFHGIPQRYCALGDVYRDHCETGAALLAKQLGLAKHEWAVTYQSRVGREPWLQPYTDETLKQWGQQGLKTIDVICPGFSADCLETLEEIQVENAHFFSQAGGQSLRYIPALNDDDAHIKMMQALILQPQAHITAETPLEQEYNPTFIPALADSTDHRRPSCAREHCYCRQQTSASS